MAGVYHRCWYLPSTRRRRPGPTHLIHPAGPSFRFTSPGSGLPVRSKSVSLRRSAAQIQISWVVHGPKERKGPLASWCRRCTRQWMGEPRWWVLLANLNDITKQAIAAAVSRGWLLEGATASVSQMPAEIWPRAARSGEGLHHNARPTSSSMPKPATAGPNTPCCAMT